MVENSELFVGFDVSKSSHAVAVAESGRMGEVRSHGSISTDSASVRRFVRKLERPNVRLRFCYEAGPTGYGLKRQIEALGHSCAVIAPSLIPRRPGERVKTDRRDAVKLARLFRAGELTEIWTPDEAHEALRDLVRTRESAIRDRTRKRQEIRSFLLRHGRTFPGKKTWGTQYFKWLSTLCFTHAGQAMVLHEMIHAEAQCRDRVRRLEAAIEEAIADWPLKPVVDRLQALRGVSLISSVTFMVEIGDIRRFESPRQLMAYLGMVPSERSSGDTIRRGGITKTGNARVRRTLIEGAWAYRYQPKVATKAYFATRHMSEDVRELAWKAQTRLTKRYRALIARGKRSTVVVTAVARELVGFMWALC